jgi:hypothetical protein
VRSRSPPRGHRFWSWCCPEEPGAGRSSSTSSTLSFLGGVAHRSLGDGRGWLDSRRVAASSGAVVASMAGLARSMR